MKTKKLLISLFFTTILCFAACAIADDDIDLRINGDFRGAPSGYSPAPGWTLTADGGNARILPTHDHDEFRLELTATPNRSQSVQSGLHPCSRSLLKLEMKIAGTGTAAFGYEALDQSGKQLVASNRQLVGLSSFEQKVEHYFKLNVPAAFIRIVLTAEPGAKVLFRDVDAELKGPAMMVTVTAPGTIIAPQPTANGGIAAPQPPAPLPPKPVTPPQPVQLKPRLDHQFLPLASLGLDEHFAASARLGKDIDLDLEEDPARPWQLVSFDPNVCRVKLEHERDGKHGHRRYKADIEIKAIRPGKSYVIFMCGPKKVTVHFTAY